MKSFIILILWIFVLFLPCVSMSSKWRDLTETSTLDSLCITNVWLRVPAFPPSDARGSLSDGNWKDTDLLVKQNTIRTTFTEFFPVMFASTLGSSAFQSPVLAVQALLGMGFLCRVNFKLNQILIAFCHEFCATIAPTHLADMTDCRPKVCGWVGVQICLLVACRVPFHTLGWKHQLDLSTLSEIGLCRCCTWWLDPCCQFPENNLLSQHQLELFEDLDKTLLSKISTECLATSNDQFRNHTSCYQKSSLGSLS